MAEQVNQRIEGMINELEQMRRTNLYDDDEIKFVFYFFLEQMCLKTAYVYYYYFKWNL